MLCLLLDRQVPDSLGVSSVASLLDPGHNFTWRFAGCHPPAVSMSLESPQTSLAGRVQARALLLAMEAG